jgi:hypothetical protein
MRVFLVSCLLFILFFSSFLVVVFADPVSRVPGVKVGDKVTYGGFLALWVSDVPQASVPQNLVDANNTLSVVNTVLSINGSVVSFESRTAYRNGTERVEVDVIDVASGNEAGNATFVAAGLGVGDRVYVSGSLADARINSTSLGDYCGLMRETNLFNVTRVFVENDIAFWTELYWDKASGVLVKQFWSYAELTAETLLTEGSIEFKMVDNDVWLGVSDSVAPVARAGSDKIGEAGVPVVFDAGESRDDVGIAGVLWDFGDGESASGLRVSHVYDVAGAFNATLTVLDSGGNRALDYVSVSVKASSVFLVLGLPLPVWGLVALAGVLVFSVGVWRVWLRRPSEPKPRSRRRRR